MEHLQSIIKELQVVSKDETGSKRAIKELVSALEADDGEQACTRLLQCSPRLEELFTLWDKGVLRVRILYPNLSLSIFFLWRFDVLHLVML